MTTRPRLLVAGLTDTREPALLARAAEVAKAFDLAVYVYYPVLYSRAAVPAPPGATIEPGGRVEHDVDRYERCVHELENALETLRSRGLVADGRVERCESVAGAALDQVAALDPRYVMIAPKPHAKLAAALLSDDDFELIRLCSKPLWLVRQYPEERRTVLAAIEAMHAGDDASLDHAVVATGVELARGLHREAHAVHAAAAPTPTRLAAVMEAVAPKMLDERHQQTEDRHVRRTHEIARAHGISVDHVHVSTGDLIDNLHDMVRPMAVDLVVVGALSRTRLKRVFTRGIVERLFQATETDIVVVKPPDAAHSGSI